MDTAEIRLSSLIDPNVELIARPRINTRALRFVGYVLVATLLPLLGLLIYMDYAAAQGIVLENGCHGPGAPFGFLSGLLFAIQLRVFEAEKASP